MGKVLRCGIDIGQNDLASKLNIEPTIYKKYENGYCEPNFQTLINISNFFNVSTDYLLGVTESKNHACNKHSILIDEIALSEDENQLFKSYRKLSVIMKAELRGEIKGILRSFKYEPPAIKEVKNFIKKGQCNFC